MVTSRILQANGYDWKAAARICGRVERPWVATCFQSYGRDASGFTRQNPTEIVRLCKLAGKGESDCIYGAARDMSANYAGGEEAAGLCNIAPAGMRGPCFNGIGTILGGLHATTPERRAACRAITRKYAEACARGAGVPA